MLTEEVSPLRAPVTLCMSPAYCGEMNPHSCECFRRCSQFFCGNTSAGGQICDGYNVAQSRRCFHREGVDPDQQYSAFPEEDEKGIKYLAGWLAGVGKEVDRRQGAAYALMAAVVVCPPGSLPRLHPRVRVPALPLLRDMLLLHIIAAVSLP